MLQCTYKTLFFISIKVNCCKASFYILQRKERNVRYALAEVAGLEPTTKESKSFVLPLHHTSV